MSEQFSFDVQTGPVKSRLPALDVLLLHLFLAGDMIISARFYEFIGFSIRSPLLYMTVASLLVFALRMLQKSYLPEIVIFLLLIVGMVIQIVHFTAISRQAENFNSLAQYYTLFSFVVFSNFIGEGDIDYLLKTIYRYACIYVVIYVVASVLVTVNLLPGDITARLTQTDVERGARILIVSSTTLYCLHYAYFNYLATRKYSLLLMVIFSMAALLISQSRLLIVVAVLLWSVSIVFRSRSALSTFAFVAFLALSGGMLFGMIDAQWNPFTLFGDDTSALVRTRGYESVRQILTVHPALGVGIANDDADLVAFTSNPTLAAADLGPIGIWFVFGLGGLVLYVVSVYVQCFCTRFGGCGTVGNNKAIQYTACVIGLFGCLTPTWFNGSIVGIFFALYLRGQSSSLHSEAVVPRGMIEANESYRPPT